MDAPAVAEVHKWLDISLESWLTIAAVVVGPILALYAQRLLDDFRERRDRQTRAFRELMITRSTRLSPRHVEALNGVPLEFKNIGKEKQVIEAWKAYLTHLNTDANKNPEVWNRTGSVLLIELLYEMSRRLGYKFGKLDIENEVYLPRFFNDLEVQQNNLRMQLLELLDGKGTRKLPVAVFEKKFPDLTDQPKQG
jgi:hypothetical protein